MKTSLQNQRPDAAINSASNRLFTADDEPPVLVVVDMQLEFKASRDPETLDEVAAEIKGAIARGEAIIFLEYKDSKSGTYQSLLALVQGYQFWTTAEKKNDGGAKEVFDACMDNGYWPENFRICGVNADGCIFATVVGLRDKLPNSRIEVVRHACHTDSGWANWHTRFAKLKNVAVV